MKGGTGCALRQICTTNSPESAVFFYNLYPVGTQEDRVTFETLSDMFGRRERDILRQLASLHTEDEPE